MAPSGGLLALTYDPGVGDLVQLWRSGTCSPDGSRVPDNTGGVYCCIGPDSGASIHDLDNDGSPEVIYGGVVYDADGCLIGSSLGFVPYSVGYIPVVADVDLDGEPELVRGSGVYSFDPVAGDFVLEYPLLGPSGEGQVAVGDFGDFPLTTMDSTDIPEIAVISSGSVFLETLEGEVVFGPVTIPGGGTGPRCQDSCRVL